MLRRWSFILFSVLAFPAFSSTDTLRLSLPQAEERFLKENLWLLAGQYNVDAQQALIIQAKLWNNPTLSTELNAYNPERDKFFDVGKQGEKVFALEQVIMLGGKRKNSIALARENAHIASLELNDLLRNLKFQLRTSFYSVFYDSQTLQRYDHQLRLLSSIIGAYQLQSERGNIPLKEVLRLKAVYYQLNSAKTELIRDIQDDEANLKLLLHGEDYIQPIADDSLMVHYSTTGIVEDDLLKLALDARPDYLEAVAANNAASLNYRLQRSMAVPDVSVGGAFDQRGGAFVNQVGLTLAIGLPVFNRNQGNVKSAQYMINRTQTLTDQKKFEVRSQVVSTWQKLLRIEQEYQLIDDSFRRDFEKMNEGIVTNFQKRNIGMLEFVDFFESYNNNIQELNRLTKTRLQAYEELNTVVGVELFNQ